MKVFAVVTVANEVGGNFTAVKFEKAFTQATKAEAYVKDLSKEWRELVPHGNANIECLCQRGVHELEVEE